MKRLLVLAFIATAGYSTVSVGAPQPERIRGTVTAVSADQLTVHTATGDVTLSLSGDTKYLTETRTDLDHIAAGGYIGVATKNVGDKLVALDVLVFPPALKGAAQGHFDWDKVADTTLSGGPRTASTMTNGTVAASAASEAPVSVNSTMTNGSVATATTKNGAKQVKLTYDGGEQMVLVPPTAPIIDLQFGAASDIKTGDVVFVNAALDNGKHSAGLVLVGSASVAPPI